MILKNLYVYDLECYPNFFSLAIGNMECRKMKVFEISSRKDQREEMFKYLRGIVRAKGYMVGFNNLSFDYPVLHFILKNKDCTVIEIYQKAQSLVENFNDRFANIVSDKDTLIPQIDLFKIHHFDNKARMTSLKVLEFNMRMDNIEELPYPVGSWLTDSQIDNLIKYNRHDVKATALFLENSIEQLNFRFELSNRYGRNFLNFNDTKIGKDHLITELEKANKGCCYQNVDGKRKIQQTKRHNIKLGECIFPYVKFNRPEFDAVKKWFSQQVINETKGVFTDILESDLGDVAKYAKLITKKLKCQSKPSDKDVVDFTRMYPKAWLEEKVLKSGKVSYWWNWNVAESLNVVVDGLHYVFGVGGIHASVESQTLTDDDEWMIVDVDVSSYYPNLSIKNRIHPEHLGEIFCDIYEGMYEQRKGYAKGSAENAMLKLALNGSYGAGNDQYSPLYDPMWVMKITINGQLSLCMLAEKLIEIEGLQIIACNTDGITYRCKREHDAQAQAICKEWCEITKLELERVEYRMMAIANVNNYLAVTTKGKVKTKGSYEWENLSWNKNHSNLIIGKAVQEYLVNGTPLENTIMNHSDIFDFMARAKVPRSSKLVMVKEDGTETLLQNTCRYYVSKSGGSMVKIMPPLEYGKTVWDCVDESGETERVNTKQKMEARKRKGFKIYEIELPAEDRRIGINVGQIVTPCNDMNQFKGLSDIDYDWYIKEAKKLITFDLTGEDNVDITD